MSNFNSSSIAMILKSLFSSSSKVFFFHGDCEFAPIDIINENGIQTVELFYSEYLNYDGNLDLSDIKEFHLIKCEMWSDRTFDKEEMRIKNIIIENNNIKIFF